ncbi:threonine synthase [PVC group bacterium (ex Bugula neritina AB1)]|nr:threonine synthase [PVC group bacterium (ex Bugula neritina AB1)]
MRNEGIIETYRRFLPVEDTTPIVSLREGQTPLIKADRLSKKIGCFFDIYLKYEGMNPTGSFKDRGMTMAVTKAYEEKAKMIICASTGNTSASAAAYAARCGMKCFVLIPEGNIALGKLAQAMLHGAQVIQVRGNFDDAFEQVCKISQDYPITLVNSVNPYRIEGQKTASFEIVDVLGDAPTYHAIPVGNAGNISAYWKGYKEYKNHGKSSSLPKMIGFQAEGAAPIVKGYPIEAPQTVATAIRIGNPASWETAERARDESGGIIESVTDEEILEAYALLASLEGVFVEPASAASVAGVIKKFQNDFFEKETVSVVCTVTGHGLKDPQNAIACAKDPFTVDDNTQDILKCMGF